MMQCQKLMALTGTARGSGARRADYFFVYPNTMVNRYGPWLDVSAAWPAPARGGAPVCTVQTTWWLDARLAGDAGYVAAGLAASNQARCIGLG